MTSRAHAARISRAPEPEELIQLASRLLTERKLDEVLGCCERAVYLGASPLSVAYERWMCHMLRGDFEAAWRETDRTEAERRANAPAQDCLPPHLRRLWTGEPLEGKTVLVRCYHGLGDTIQFVRYIPLLAARAKHVILQCQRTLAPLIECVPGIAELFVLEKDIPHSAWDLEIELMELPYAFRTTLETLPREILYLSLQHATQQELNPLFRKPGFKVGLAWSSGGWDSGRDIPLAAFEPLCAVPGLRLFSLQRGESAQQLSKFRTWRIIEAEKENGTILDTVAAILSLDLVLSADTMVAHLAGALGKPVWTLLPFCADWRWMVERSDSPWYPTMRLFRRASDENWSCVVQRVVSEISRLIPLNR